MFVSQKMLLRHNEFEAPGPHPQTESDEAISPLGVRLAAHDFLAYGLVELVLVVFVAMPWTVPTVLDISSSCESAAVGFLITG